MLGFRYRALVFLLLLGLTAHLFATENRCRAADFEVNFQRTIVLGRLDSVQREDSRQPQYFYYDQNGKVSMQVSVGDTMYYTWSGRVMNFHEGDGDFRGIVYFNSESYPDSVVYQDSMGQVAWREQYRYGENFVLVYDSEADAFDSVSFSNTGLKHYADDGVLIKQCETVANYCSCQTEGNLPGEWDTTLYYSTGDYLDSVRSEDGTKERFYWSQPHSSMVTFRKQRLFQPSLPGYLANQRDILGRLRRIDKPNAR